MKSLNSVAAVAAVFISLPALAQPAEPAEPPPAPPARAVPAPPSADKKVTPRTTAPEPPAAEIPPAPTPTPPTEPNEGEGGAAGSKETASDPSVVPTETESESALETPPAPAAPAPEEGDAAKPEDTEPAEPAEEPTTAKPSADGSPQTPVNLDEYLAQQGELEYPGYIPGYRKHSPLGLNPYVPNVGATGGVTPGFGAPTLTDEWTFRWSGYMTASLQFSIDARPNPKDGQSMTVVNTPQSTVDEWWSFLSTGSVLGNWIGMNFSYGNKTVTAFTSIDTWNPAYPSTFLQLGSQYFINRSYLQFTPDSVAGWRSNWKVGYLDTGYGQLGKYGGGMYPNAITGVVLGIGEILELEYDLSDKYMLIVQHGIAANRNGNVPFNVVPTAQSRWENPARASDWVNHTHVGFMRHGDPSMRLVFHHMYIWSQDDTNTQLIDNPDTRAIDESDPPDVKLSIYGVDATFESPRLGYLGIGASYTDGKDAWQMRAVRTYGGDGEFLSQRWWGEDTGGTGGLFVLGMNYAFSVGSLMAYPDEFAGDQPDILVNTGFHLTATKSENEAFDGRVRHKYGADVDYRFWEYMGAAVRVDRVVPSSLDAAETFHVLAPRIYFKSKWYAHEEVSLRYVKWFYGSRTRTEATGERSIDRIDDQLVALNFNMYW